MRLQRVFNSSSHGTTPDGEALGVMRDDNGKVFFTTFEDKPIPAGTYQVKLMPAADNPKHGESWEVRGVPGRTDILFHVGNDASDSEGCILVGFGFAGRAITFSADAYRRFRKFLAGHKLFTLQILDP
jgi:hypothetical protein